MKKMLTCLVALASSLLLAQMPVKTTTVQARGPDGFFGPVIPNNLVLTLKNQIINEIKTYISTNTSSTITIEDVVNSSEFQTAVSNNCMSIVTPEMVQEIVGTNVITEAQAATIINDAKEIKIDNEQFKTGFEFITNVTVTSDMSVEELKSALVTIICGIQAALGSTTNVVIHPTQP